VLIAITNASTLCADTDIATIAQAVGAQMVDVSHAWDREVPSVAFVALADYPNATYDIGVVVFDDSDQAGALGYHSVDPWGNPFARCFARDSIAYLTGFDPSTLSGAQSPAEVLSAVGPVVSHEIIESFVDPSADLWADDQMGMEEAYEAADPIESSTFTVTLPGDAVVTLSDWVTPAYFDPQSTAGPYDFLDQLAAPFSLAPGGYMITMAEGAVTAVYGDHLPAWRRAQHEAAERDAREGGDTARMASRTAKRFAHALARPTLPPGTEPLAPGAAEPAPEPPGTPETPFETGQQEPPSAIAGVDPSTAAIPPVGAPVRAPQPGEASVEVDNTDPANPVVRSLV
jgi:hypothetical protein